MTLNIITDPKQIKNRIDADIQAQLPTSNPYLQESFVGSLTTGIAGRSSDTNLAVLEVIKQAFLQSATLDEFIKRAADYKGLSLRPATPSAGTLVIEGVPATTTIVPLGTQFTSSAGLFYTTTQIATVTDTSISVVSLTRLGATVTATTASDHLLGSGIEVSITGVLEPEYNITAKITVGSATTFTYEIVGTPATPATGTIVASFTTGTAPIQSLITGADTLLDPNTALNATGVIVGLTGVNVMGIAGAIGGSDLESLASLKKRALFAFQHPITNFNAPAIEIQAKKIVGVTRVFPFDISDTNPGETKIFFMRDNDPNPIPTSVEVKTVKDKILEIKTFGVAPTLVKVFAPTPVVVKFNFTQIDPSNASMQDAIRNSITQFFKEETFVGESVKEDGYRGVIFSTVDPTTGTRLKSFTLSVPPPGDVLVGDGEIGISLNTDITFNAV